MSRMWFDAAGAEGERMSARGELDRLRGLGGRASKETENRFDRVRASIDRSSDDPRWREDCLDDVRALVKSALGDVDDDDDAGAQDMSPDSVAARICDPARSSLARLTNAPSPIRHVR